MARLKIDLIVDTKKGTHEIKGFGRATESAMGKAKSAATSLGKGFLSLQGLVVGLAGAYGLYKLIGAAKEWIGLANEQEAVEKRLSAVLKATGQAAGYNINELKDMASAMQEVTTVGDEVILAGMSILSTFKQIRGEAFERTTAVALDMAEVMQQDLKGAMVMISKAMNDPIANLSAMSKAGVQFTKEQKEQIKTLWESGKTMEAQNIILTELESQFGGVAKAARETFGGAVKATSNTLGDMKEQLGSVITENQFFIDQIQDAEGIIKGFTKAIEENKDLLQDLAKGGFEYLGLTVQNLESIIESVQGLIARQIRGRIRYYELQRDALRALVEGMHEDWKRLLPDWLSGLEGWRKKIVGFEGDIERLGALLQAIEGIDVPIIEAGVVKERYTAEINQINQLTKAEIKAAKEKEKLQRKLYEEIWKFGMDNLDKKLWALSEEYESHKETLGDTLQLRKWYELQEQGLIDKHLKITIKKNLEYYRKMALAMGATAKEINKAWDEIREHHFEVTSDITEAYIEANIDILKSTESTANEIRESLRRLTDLWKRDMLTWQQKAQGMFLAFRVGFRRTIEEATNRLEIMYDAGSKMATALWDAWKGSFSDLIKGDFGNILERWKDFAQKVVDAFEDMLASMLASWALGAVMKAVEWILEKFGLELPKANRKWTESTREVATNLAVVTGEMAVIAALTKKTADDAERWASATQMATVMNLMGYTGGGSGGGDRFGGLPGIGGLGGKAGKAGLYALLAWRGYETLFGGETKVSQYPGVTVEEEPRNLMYWAKKPETWLNPKYWPEQFLQGFLGMFGIPAPRIFSRAWPNVGLGGELGITTGGTPSVYHTKDIGGPGNVQLDVFQGMMDPVIEMYQNLISLFPQDLAESMRAELPKISLDVAAGRKDMDVLGEKYAAAMLYETYNQWGMAIMDALERYYGLPDIQTQFGITPMTVGGPGATFMGGRFGGLRYNWEFDKALLERQVQEAYEMTQLLIQGLSTYAPSYQFGTGLSGLPSTGWIYGHEGEIIHGQEESRRIRSEAPDTGMPSGPMYITIQIGKEEFEAYVANISDDVRVQAERRRMGTRRMYS